MKTTYLCMLTFNAIATAFCWLCQWENEVPQRLYLFNRLAAIKSSESPQRGLMMWSEHIWKGLSGGFRCEILGLCVFGWLSCGNPLSILRRGVVFLCFKKNKLSGDDFSVSKMACVSNLVFIDRISELIFSLSALWQPTMACWWSWSMHVCLCFIGHMHVH